MGRKSKNLNERNKFYILTNGRKTECNYFNLLKQKKSIYDVSVKFCNDDPLHLVEQASCLVKEANQVWCVFDIDYTYEENRLLPALKLAKENGIKIAFSNIAFEVWLIYHYQKLDPPKTINKLQDALSEILIKQGCKNGYAKVNEEQLETYFIPHIKEAIINAKISYQKWATPYNAKYPAAPYPIWKWNPCSSVFELVEALELKELNNDN